MTTTQHWIGQTLAGRYRIRRLIGSGGMGAIFEGEHLELGKRVAIKLLSAASQATADVEARLRQEARSASAVESEHIVNVYDVGRDAAAGLYLVMEYLEGEDLETRLARVGRLDVATAVVLASQIARGLAKAHASGVTHRDLKPANVFLVKREDGSLLAKIVDFGIAKFRSDTAPERGGRITRDGAVVGTAQYMAPEQAQGLESADHRVDIWALGTLLYECLSGRPAYEELATYEQTLVAIVTSSPPPLAQIAPDVPQPLAALVHSALRHDPEQRPWDCFTFLKQLEEAVPALFPGGSRFRIPTPAGVALVPRGWPDAAPGWPAAKVAASLPQGALAKAHGAPPLATPHASSAAYARTEHHKRFSSAPPAILDIAPNTPGLGAGSSGGHTVRLQPITLETTTNVGVMIGRPVRRRAQETLEDAEPVGIPGLARRSGMGLFAVAVIGIAAVLGVGAKRWEQRHAAGAAPDPNAAAAAPATPAPSSQATAVASSAQAASAQAAPPSAPPSGEAPSAGAKKEPAPKHAPAPAGPAAHAPARGGNAEIPPLPNFPVPVEAPTSAPAPTPAPASAPSAAPAPVKKAPAAPREPDSSEANFGGVTVTDQY